MPEVAGTTVVDPVGPWEAADLVVGLPPDVPAWLAVSGLEDVSAGAVFSVDDAPPVATDEVAGVEATVEGTVEGTVVGAVVGAAVSVLPPSLMGVESRPHFCAAALTLVP